MMELLASEWRGEIQTLLGVALCLAALIWGSRPERIVALTWLGLFEIIAPAYSYFNGGIEVESVDWFLASLDMIAAVIWVGVALNANRNYTLWIAGLQLLAVMAHFARAVTDTISPIAYVSMFVAPGWVQLLVLALGLGRHIVRKRRFGAYRDWRKSLHPVANTDQGARLVVRPIPDSDGNWREDLK